VDVNVENAHEQLCGFAALSARSAPNATRRSR
jgi:hypothetical protein